MNIKDNNNNKNSINKHNNNNNNNKDQKSKTTSKQLGCFYQVLKNLVSCIQFHNSRKNCHMSSFP